jgi:hypothetical protein
MARTYFRQVPDFDYVSRNNGEKNISHFITVKNLFKRGKLREDIFGNLSFFEKYSIVGDERPDNVAYKFYNDSSLDWVILLSNNILNIQTEWPVAQTTFDKFLLDKYGSYDTLYNGIHHYETLEIRNSIGALVLQGGLHIKPTWNTNGNFVRNGSSYYYEYFDSTQNQNVQVPSTSFIIEVTNFEYENRLQDKKRNIYALKSKYLNIVFNDMDDIMPYKMGSTQYVNATLKKGDNIRLYE